MLAAAKINLALDILGKRSDGYHEMYMILQSISLGDILSAQEATTDLSKSTGFQLQIQADPDNLFTPIPGKSLEERTAERFFQVIKQSMPPLIITLQKHTPAYAGLGGGSSDIAALLRILRQNYAPDLSDEKLEQIGLEIGSDVPFCIRGGTALAQGRGEILTDLPAMPDCWLVLCKPDFNCKTPEQFARFDAITQQKSLSDLSLLSPIQRPDIDGMRSALASGDLNNIAARLNNIFEWVLPEPSRRIIFEIKHLMRDSGALNAVMSGSGPTVFGIFREKITAENAVKILKRLYRQVFLVKPLARSV